MEKSLNNRIKIATCTCLVSMLFFWCPSLPLWILKLITSICQAGGILCLLSILSPLLWEEYDVNDFFFLLNLGYAQGHLGVFANTFLHLALSSLVCKVTLHPNVLYKSALHKLDGSLCFLCCPKTDATRFHICISLPDHR